MFKLRPRYFLASLALLGVLVFIALFVRDQFVRPFLGDVLAVIWLYLTARALLDRSPALLATAVLLCAVALEVAQYVGVLTMLDLQHSRLARVILGATFDPLDLLAYVTGWGLILALERVATHRLEREPRRGS